MTAQAHETLHARQGKWAERLEKEMKLRKAWDNLDANDQRCTITDSLYVSDIAQLLADELSSSEDNTFHLIGLLRAGFRDFLQMEIDNDPN